MTGTAYALVIEREGQMPLCMTADTLRDVVLQLYEYVKNSWQAVLPDEEYDAYSVQDAVALYFDAVGPREIPTIYSQVPANGGWQLGYMPHELDLDGALA